MQIKPEIRTLNLPFSVPLPTGPIDRSVNVVLICSETLTLIDSGTAGAETRIFDYLRSIGRQPEELSLLLLTHSHPDHIGAARAVVAASGCQVAAHAAERAWIEDVELQVRERPVPGFHALVGGAVPVDRILVEAERVAVGGGAGLEVLHTPGHSRGSLSFWYPEEALLITGDALPVPDEMPIFDSLHDSLASLKRLQALPAKQLISAWEPPLSGAAIGQRFEASHDWLMKIKASVDRVARNNRDKPPMTLCAEVVAALGLPPFAVNPLVARSLVSCLA